MFYFFVNIQIVSSRLILIINWIKEFKSHGFRFLITLVIVYIIEALWLFKSFILPVSLKISRNTERDTLRIGKFSSSWSVFQCIIRLSIIFILQRTT